MPSEERGGRWREGMREKDAEGRVRSRVGRGKSGLRGGEGETQLSLESPEPML